MSPETQTLDAFGQVDIHVNNAGVTRRADIMDLTEADWDRIHRVNAKGVFFCLHRVTREMIPRNAGCIINIASIAGKGYAGASNVAYVASKGAVIGLKKLAALPAGSPQHQRQFGLPRRDAHSSFRRQSAGPGSAGRCDDRGDGAPEG